MLRNFLLLTLFTTGRALKAPTVTNTLAARVTLSPLPVVFSYDHCPFCVRVRLALGVKNVKHNVVFLANDDVATPTALIGKKIAPIFQMPGEFVMPESLDIIAKVDSDPRFGSPGMFKVSGSLSTQGGHNFCHCR
jgi:glutaredoxin 2